MTTVTRPVAVGRVPKTCEECEESYLARSTIGVRWCPSCRAVGQKKANNERMKARWLLLPLERRQAMAKKQNNSPKALRARQIYRILDCSGCGERKHYGVRLADRPTYLCGACKRRGKLLTRACRFCGLPVTRKPSQFRSQMSCASCIGAYTRVAKVIGLSRERVRQLANIEIRLGFAINARAALDILLAGDRHTPARPRKPKPTCPGCGERKHLWWQGFCRQRCAAAFAVRQIKAPSSVSTGKEH